MRKYDEILLSIIIIVKNEEKRIGHCLESLLLQFDEKCMELILVDGNSSDKTVDVIKKFVCKNNYIKLIECKKCGYSYQRNIGINNAKGKFVLYISGDTEISKGMLSRYMENVRKDTYDILQGTIINIENNSKYGKLMKEIYPIFYKNVTKNFAQEFSTVNVCIRRELLQKYSFDEKLHSMEDKEWLVRIGVKEEEIRFCRCYRTCVYHLVHENMAEYCRKIYNEAVALEQINKKYRDKYNTNFFNWINYSKISLFFLFFGLGIIGLMIAFKQVYLILLLIAMLLFLKQVYISKYYFDKKACNIMYNVIISVYLDVVFYGYAVGKIKRKIKERKK